MNIHDFLKLYQDKPKGYCPCVIDSQGAVYECPEGHLNALFDLDEGRSMFEKIPDNVAPLFFMLKKTGAVAVDYEAQVYSGVLTAPQQQTLDVLSSQGFIVANPQNVRGKIYL